MYTIQIKVFKEYVNADFKANRRPAKRAAEKLHKEGWLYIRIINPSGKVTQVYGEEGE